MSKCYQCGDTGKIEVLEDDENICCCSILAASPGMGPPCGACENEPEEGYPTLIYDCYCGAGEESVEKYMSPFTGKLV